ncbi:MAG TPA: hypothetical protein VGU90_04030 [Terriglobales bacterium]|nr:hypothetical protein [Terriglobales bacterium]
MRGPTGFALEGLVEGLGDAELVYEKTTSGRARNAGQELHYAGRTAAPQEISTSSAHQERPGRGGVVAWAAGNGDRSENADYQYGKRRLRQIDGRIRFLSKRIEAAEVADPEAPRAGRRRRSSIKGSSYQAAASALSFVPARPRFQS